MFRGYSIEMPRVPGPNRGPGGRCYGRNWGPGSQIEAEVGPMAPQDDQRDPKGRPKGGQGAPFVSLGEQKG